MNQEEAQVHQHKQEKEILSQLAKILVSENLMSPEEHIRFLAALKEE